MVMKRNAMRKNLRQSIIKSLGRYIAIVMIIALGASMFVGLLMTKSDMVATGQKFMDDMNMFDLRLINSYGWTQYHVDAVSEMDGLVDVEGIRYTDLIVNLNDSTDDLVYRVYAMPEKVNLFDLRGGRLPEAPDECVIDGYHMDDSILGTRITLSATNEEDAFDAVKHKTYTIVGYIASPLYVDMNRGTTSVGNGSLSNYIYIPRESLDLDYYTEIHVTIPGEYDIYSDAYNEAMEAMAEKLEPQLHSYAHARMLEVRRDALESYQEGLREYNDGIRQFEEGKLEAQQELEDAHQQLLDAEQQIADSEKMIANGEQQLSAGRAQLYEGQKELNEGREQFEKLKNLTLGNLVKTEETLTASLAAAQAKSDELALYIRDAEGQIHQIRSTIAAEEGELNQLNSDISGLDGQIGWLDGSIQAAQWTRQTLNLMPHLNAALISQLDAQIAQMTQQKSELQAQRSEKAARVEELNLLLQEPLSEIEALEEQKEAYEQQKAVSDLSLQGIQNSMKGITASREALEAEFAATEAELAAGEKQIADGWAQIYAMEAQLADGKVALEEGKKELEQGWIDYEEGKLKAQQEIADAEAELADAKRQLDNAKDLIASMTENKVMVLDRNSNVGYNSLDSASNIVSGVSRVFPAFFLLVAALVCITTMTRMIDEERTQIGTLKALGYSNGAIISKYLFYAGSGAIVGCGLGVIVGSMAFPTILWQAYKIMLHITDDILLHFNWWLCGAVVGAYTIVMLLVTWYCCRRALKEEPAELIRPKAPDPGKKILLERLPLWNKLSFLNKVTIRNIFRYRQRLAMMMVGIGGCTALLVTGFGLRDSIVNVVDYQFQEVTLYDLSVYFSDHQPEENQEEFIRDVSFGAENVLFYHQSSVDIEVDNHTKEIYLIAAGDRVTEFIDLHCGDDPIAVPGMGQAVLSSGVADALGVNVGDKVSMRNADMQVLDVTISGIYDNHVENYVIVNPSTIEDQWEEPPAMQMAFVQAKDDQDVHELSAEIAGLPYVMNVSVSEDFANMVGNMMEALDLVVIVIVVCAGLLAAIVLYNLTNININERIREIATIKVLGFNAKETAAYIFKENLSLTAVGSVLGLGLGYVLLLFVMSQIRIDMVWFKALVMPISYILSLVLTMLAACIVDFIFYFKLDKINMAEALKSVE